MNKYPFIQIIENSVILSDVELIQPIPWSAGICQDIHHSVYITHTQLKKILSDNVDTPYDEELLLIQYIVKSLTRPFCITWHTEFFDNFEYRGTESVISRPKEKVSLQIKSAYRAEFLHLKGLLRDICLHARDPEWVGKQMKVIRPDLFPPPKEEDQKNAEAEPTESGG